MPLLRPLARLPRPLTLLPRCGRAGARLRRTGMAWLSAALGAWAVVCALPAKAAPGDCSVQWQITPRLDTNPRSLEMRMAFDGGGRSRTSLRLPAGWDLVAESSDSPPRLQPVPGDGQLRQVRHAPGERVQLQWRLTPASAPDSAGPMLTPRWFAFTGDSVLPWPDELAAQPNLPVCVDLAAPTGASRLISSFGVVEAAQAHWALNAGVAQVQRGLFAGGALQWRELRQAGQPLTVAMPEPAPFGFNIGTLADTTAANITSLRRGWGGADAAPLLVLLLPAERGLGGVALHQAVALQAPADLALPGAGFDELLAKQWLRTWLPERLGPLAHLGRGDSTLRAWFTDGFADFLAHRWLLREGRWSPDDYATALNRKLARYQALPELDADNLRVASGRAGPEALLELPPARGEWLALSWHQALRRAGQPGLEAVLRGLVVPAGQARREGPLSAPLATHRLLAAVRKPLGDAPLRDLTHHIDEGARFNFGPGSLGPCFQLAAGGAGASTPVYKAQDKAMDRTDCQAWLNGGPALRGEDTGGALLTAALPSAGRAATVAAGPGTPANAAADDEDDGPATTTRRVCSTPKAAKGAKGAKGAKAAKAKPVCKTITVPAAKGRTAAAGGRGSAAVAGKPGAKAGKAVKGGKAAKAGKVVKGSKAAQSSKPGSGQAAAKKKRG